MWTKIKSNIQYSNNLIHIEKEKYTNVEILEYCKKIEKDYIANIISDSTDNLITKIKCLKKEHIK